jgi:5-methylcytosine-specific restriction endonuclease McrA
METLVLSTAWEPVQRITWQRAMVLLTAGRAEVVESYDGRYVRTVRVTFDMPSVVRFVGMTRRWRRRSIRFSRQNVWLRDRRRCQYCGVSLERHQSTYDHVVPRCHGGATSWSNVVIACFGCNQRKGGRTPLEAGMRLLTQPRRPRSLPGPVGVTVTWDPGMPLTWRQYVSDMSWWNSELWSS